MSSALKRAKELDREGVTELNIIGQDISGYGLDLYQGLKLTDLLKKIIRATSRISWLRLLYLYPSRVSEDLLKLIADEGRLCKYLDLPIQHINSRILKLMRRHTRSADIRRLIERARRLIPDLAIRTSVIVGFPSETDAEFKELLRFIEEVKFERLGAFIYSREEGTPAYNFKGQIPQRVQRERFNAVMRVQQEISRENNQKFLGQVLELLIDEKEDGHYLGRTQYDAPEVDGLVYVHSAKPLRPGDLVRVRIKDALEYDLTGEVVL
jgi:ribosomal protein S12 methylthiotransferase